MSAQPHGQAAPNSADVSQNAASSNPHWFDYDQAFSRNIGWLTEWEQQKLRVSKIAIAGMGGVGGIHMLTLARLGIGRFAVADFDHFEVANFNRQMGASVRTLGAPKADSVVMLAREINPELDVTLFNTGVDESNMEAFLDGVDVYVDGLDFFVLDVRRKLFALARAKGITAVTAAPIGMGTGYLIFTPDSMSFDDYFGFKDGDTQGNYVRFLLGLTPAMLHRQYLQDPSRVDMMGKRGPSTAIACQLCAGVAASEVVKIILQRGPIKAAPFYHHFDAYTGRHVVRKLRYGVDGPVIGLKRRIIQALVRSYSKRARPVEVELPANASVMERIVDVARWAPSPDNSQPWAFETVGDDRLRMILDIEPENPYQYAQSQPNWLSAGMMLEALRLSALDFGRALTWTRQGQIFDLHFPVAAVTADPLSRYIKIRSVDRSAYRRRALLPDIKVALEQACGPGFSLRWLESTSDRLAYARLAARSTALRLKSQACHHVHQKVIDWQALYSRDGLPAGSLGVNKASQMLLRWGLRSWSHMMWLNRLLRADVLASAEMDLLPGFMSSAYVTVSIDSALPIDETALLIAGSRVYRLWLAATQQGLAFQPALGPLFAAAAAAGRAPLVHLTAGSRALLQTVPVQLQRLTGQNGDQLIFAARLGYARKAFAKSRSIRHPLAKIVVNKP
jgi:sulfur-carrier protein adenylyltransferase/sulfurtransferase